jgi:hypothetical protein
MISCGIIFIFSVAVLAFIAAAFCLLLCVALESGSIKETETLRIIRMLNTRKRKVSRTGSQ